MNAVASASHTEARTPSRPPAALGAPRRPARPSAPLGASRRPSPPPGAPRRLPAPLAASRRPPAPPAPGPRSRAAASPLLAAPLSRRTRPAPGPRSSLAAPGPRSPLAAPRLPCWPAGRRRPRSALHPPIRDARLPPPGWGAFSFHLGAQSAPPSMDALKRGPLIARASVPGRAASAALAARTVTALQPTATNRNVPGRAAVCQAYGRRPCTASSSLPLPSCSPSSCSLRPLERNGSGRSTAR